MSNGLLNTNYNPDVLSCLANLSSDEVFTPPEVVNNMLDMLPEYIWSDSNATFLDPGTKSGVFLREIAKRLDKGLEAEIPDRQERFNHILSKQLYGIAITELTALLSRRSVYCSKTANGPYSVCEVFDDEDGNIIFNPSEHYWDKAARCKFCGTNFNKRNRDEGLEAHAYEFIHTHNPDEIFNMKFDVIIGNPPYQLETGGPSRQAKPIYNLFVEQAKKLNPKFVVMIIPSRWFSGGMGLNKFREDMLKSKQISHLVEYSNASEVFPGVDIAGGVCYFLWDKNHNGQCLVTNVNGDERLSMERPLDEFNIFIRSSKAIPILRKIMSSPDYKNGNLSEVVSAIKPFGLPTNYKPQDTGVPCWFIQKIGLKYANESDFKDSANIKDKWKLLIPKAPIAGQTDLTRAIRIYHNKNAFIAKPGEICTESWIVAGAFDTEEEVVSYKSYIFTKVVRFLILQTIVSQDVNRMNYTFVPTLPKYDQIYSDEVLCERWGITAEEYSYIDSRILETDSVHD